LSQDLFSQFQKQPFDFRPLYGHYHQVLYLYIYYIRYSFFLSNFSLFLIELFLINPLSADVLYILHMAGHHLALEVFLAV